VNEIFEQPDDATPLTPEEMRELIPAHIAYRRELNEAEQENISRAQDWALNRRRDPLSEKFVKDMHRRMFDDVWRWAGRFRMSERNLGIVFHEIPVALRQLLDDARALIEYRTYSPEEIAVRFEVDESMESLQTQRLLHSLRPRELCRKFSRRGCPPAKSRPRPVLVRPYR